MFQIQVKGKNFDMNFEPVKVLVDRQRIGFLLPPRVEVTECFVGGHLSSDDEGTWLDFMI